MTAEDLLPVGTIVTVTEPATGACEAYTYVAKIVGYDLGYTKYELGVRYAGWDEYLFAAGGSWAFPGDVTVWSATGDPPPPTRPDVICGGCGDPGNPSAGTT